MRVNLNLAVHSVVVAGFPRQVMNPLLFPVLFKIVIMMVMTLMMRETMEITMWPPWECASALEVFFLRFSQLKEAGTRTSPQLLVASEHIEKLWMRPVWLFPLTYDEEYSPRTGSGRVYDFGGGGLKQKKLNRFLSSLLDNMIKNHSPFWWFLFSNAWVQVTEWKQDKDFEMKLVNHDFRRIWAIPFRCKDTLITEAMAQHEAVGMEVVTVSPLLRMMNDWTGMCCCEANKSQVLCLHKVV